MDLIWILLVYLVSIIVITPTETVVSVSICQNETYTNTNYQLIRARNEPANCTCLLKSTEGISTDVLFNMTYFNGCKYKLAVYVKGKSSFLSCSSTGPIFEEITSDIIKLNLEPNNGNGDDTTFILSIWTLPETNLTLSCFVAKIIEPSTTPFISTTTKSTFSTSSELGISNRQTDSTETSESEQSTISTVTVFTSVPENSSLNSTVSYTQNTVSPGVHGDDEESDDDCNADVVTAGIVGGIIGGVIVGGLIFIVIGILKYRERSKKSSSEIYSTPQHHLPESQYTDLQLSQQNTSNNSS